MLDMADERRFIFENLYIKQAVNGLAVDCHVEIIDKGTSWRAILYVKVLF